MTQPPYPQPDPAGGRPTPPPPPAGWPAPQQPGQGWPPPQSGTPGGPAPHPQGPGWPTPQQPAPPAQGWPAPQHPAPPGPGWPTPQQPAPPGQGWPAPQQPAPAGRAAPNQQTAPGWGGPNQQQGAHHQQPAPGWPAAPPAYPFGVGPAQRPPTTKRIPEDLPFVVRPSLGRRALTLGLVTLVVGLVIACPIGLAVPSEGGGAGLLFIIPVVLLFFAVPVGLQLWLVSSGGPVLALGPAGLWIKTRPTRGQAIWLPWEAIDRIYVRRWALEKMLCVKPRDPRAGSGLGAFTAFDSGMQQAFFGTGFTATVNHADRSEDEIMRAVVGYAAGRCRVG
ncbi:hypothetical protein ACGFIY_12145 [Micromonospora chersina]|uniref:hypothetical protein n=1 Tax=Micromonospora chersina TaxID=47854 RepID=UPI00371C79E4